MATSPKKSQTKNKVPALSVTSRRDNFRRAGRVFGKEPVTIALSDLTKAHIRQLKEDPLLNVAETEIEVEAAE